MTPRALAGWRLSWLACGIAGLATFLFFRTWMPAGPSTCLLYTFAGIACPGCGMTRASAFLAHGDIVASLRLHPLAVPFALQALIAWTWWGLVLARKVRVPSPWWGITALGLDSFALLTTWLVRLMSDTLPR